MIAPADSGRAELDRALIDLWGELEETRLKLMDLLSRGSLFDGRDYLRARLREYGRTLAYLQRAIGALRRSVDDHGTGEGTTNEAASQ